MTASDDWVILQGRVVGPSLTAAGLAAWVLAKNRLETEAAGTRELQDVLDSALHSGSVGDVRVPRVTVRYAPGRLPAETSDAVVRSHCGAYSTSLFTLSLFCVV